MIIRNRQVPAKNGIVLACPMPTINYCLLLFCSFLVSGHCAPYSDSTRWWSDGTEAALEKSGTNRVEWMKALAQVPNGQREGLEFLLSNMPQRDLRTLTASF